MQARGGSGEKLCGEKKLRREVVNFKGSTEYDNYMVCK